METQTCPRRMNSIGPWERAENLDFWEVLPNGDRVCSFCGSAHPEDFERLCNEAVRDESMMIHHSDKSYKVYIYRPTVGNASEGAIKYYKWHNYTDPEAIARLEPVYNKALRLGEERSRKIFGA